jgi:hypothetical protein
LYILSNTSLEDDGEGSGEEGASNIGGKKNKCYKVCAMKIYRKHHLETLRTDG